MPASRVKVLALWLAICCGLPLTARAQQFRIYTKVYNESQLQSGQKPSIQGRSLSLFHAGKTYDLIQASDTDDSSEVTIFEPAAERFTILHTSRNLATTLSFQELDQIVDRANADAEKFLLRPKDPSDAAWDARHAFFEFQVRPNFKLDFQPKQERLSLTSPQLIYDIRVAEAKSKEDVTTYLRYADRIAQLNFVLRSQAILPGPRLAVNEALRKRQLLPVEVTLRAAIGRGVQLRAVHEFRWPLDTTDRQLIHQWESQLAAPEVRHVPFHEFHAEMVAEKPRKRS
jgi:hypothetical protein